MNSNCENNSNEKTDNPNQIKTNNSHIEKIVIGVQDWLVQSANKSSGSNLAINLESVQIEPGTIFSLTTNSSETHNHIENDNISNFTATTNDDYQLEEILKSWGLKDMYQRLKGVGIGVPQLSRMENYHVNEIFRPSELGKKIDFQFHLAKWKEGCSSATQTPPNKDSSSKQQLLNPMSLDCILSKSKIGKSIKSFNVENHYIQPRHRDQIVNIIVDYYLKELNLRPSSKEIKRLAEQIIICFPTECLETYYVNRGNSKSPTGKLYNKFEYENRKLKKFFCKPKPASVLCSDSSEENGVRDEYYAIKEVLKNLRSPREAVIENWKITSRERVDEFLKNNDTLVVNIFEDWPILKHPFLLELVEIDFNTLYPSCKSFYTKWDLFLTNIGELLLLQMKQKENIIKLEELLKKRIEMNLG